MREEWLIGGMKSEVGTCKIRPTSRSSLRWRVFHATPAQMTRHICILFTNFSNILFCIDYTELVDRLLGIVSMPRSDVIFINADSVVFETISKYITCYRVIRS